MKTVHSDTVRRQVPGKVLYGFAWASFIANIVIIGTGGAVRLTGSGLGCPDWPTCHGDSIVNTPEMGIHGIIEFGNRTLTGVLGVLAIAVLIGTIRYRRQAKDLLVLAIAVLFGILAQAIVGGITVLTGLNPVIVGFHYVASVILVVVTAIYLVRIRHWRRGIFYPERSPRLLRGALAALILASTVTIGYGVATTASGPHSGDAEATLRLGFDASLLAHLHAWPGYIAMTLAVGFVVLSLRLDRRTLATSVSILMTMAVQILVGVVQANNGLPPLLVGIHMVLAAVVSAQLAVAWQQQRATRNRATATVGQ